MGSLKMLKNFYIFSLFAVLALSTESVCNHNSVFFSNAVADDSSTGDVTQLKTDAERLIEIENTINTDKKKLAQLKKEAEDRKKIFADAVEKLNKIQGELDQAKEKFDAIEDKDSQQANSLKTEIEQLEEEHEITKKQSDLAFQAGTTVRDQIKSLEQKIAKDQEVLNDFTGKEQDTPKAQTQTKSLQTQETKQEDPTPTIPGVPKIPGLTSSPPEQPVEPSTPAIKEQMDTPKQIEARKEAKEKAQEAKKAEQIVVSYVERKSNLEDQIKLEEKLLNTAVQTRNTLDELLNKLEFDLDENIAAGASPSELRKIQNEISTAKKEYQKTTAEIESRSTHLNELHQQLQNLNAEQLKVVEEAKNKREEAESARKESIWLDSPLHPTNILNWLLTRGPRILMVIIMIVILLFVLELSAGNVAKVMAKSGRGHTEARINRADTIALSMRGGFRVIIIIGGTLLAFQEAGVDIKTILGGAAILGVAVAFGAQNLMRDYFYGFMILLEDQYGLGDVVTIGDVTGVVEKVNLRTTILRDLEGRVHFIPNGLVNRVTNRTYEWAQAVFDIKVAYKENVDKVMSLLLELANELRGEPEYKDSILDEPAMLGVDKFGDAAVTIKFILKTKPDKMWPIRRELLRRIKNRFDEEGIEIPRPWIKVETTDAELLQNKP